MVIRLCRGQAEKEFGVEVEAIGHVRHKNLVRLLGYCIEGTHRYFIVFGDLSCVTSFLLYTKSGIFNYANNKRQ